ncbi:MAG: VIT domain-containing protein [Pyrinomonadaceae bacterium MAG19_C2-C3]|nr:VIT domain-containing protein [Pyrinomonadaceae bacterium MAG19_C2-C3]
MPITHPTHVSSRQRRTRRTRRIVVVLCLIATFAVLLTTLTTPRTEAAQDADTVNQNISGTGSGALQILTPTGEIQAACPLKHTDVKAEVSGFVARVNVTQVFANPSSEKIEAVYVFPLPAMAAVDDMKLEIAGRVVRGKILRREEARSVYEAARNAGQVTGLLDQERPNIFTQSVANIPPGAQVTITISYVETLKYEDGKYEFSFPTVVGPRYIPAALRGDVQTTNTPPNVKRRFPQTQSSSATGVPDRERISPPVARQGKRAGHDIAISVNLDAGVTLDNVTSTSHEVEVGRTGSSTAIVKLKNQATIPNKDFVLHYDVAGREVRDALLTHRAANANSKEGFFTFILQPPERVVASDITPKELVFVIDTSGSMMGFPLDKAKETMKLALDGMNPRDTFNLITFSGDTRILFPEPVPATRENLSQAQSFLDSQRGEGGTEMMRAIQAALKPSSNIYGTTKPVRVVCFMTDGYVGNDMEIIAEIQKYSAARVFSFGIGNSTNRFLLDKMAEAGRGEVEYVALNDDGSAAAHRFHERIQNPLLTDISLTWDGIAVTDIYPRRTPDVFSAKPVIITGRYTRPGTGKLRLRGRTANGEYTRDINVELPAVETGHDALASLWARRKVDDLMSGDWLGIQRGQPQPNVKEQITQTGLDYRLLTQFTSFVAVEEMTITEPGSPPRKIEVPVELPDGVDERGIFGSEAESLPINGRSVSRLLMMSPGAMSVSHKERGRMQNQGFIKRRDAATALPVPAPPPVSSANDSVIVTTDADVVSFEELKPEEQKRRATLAKLQPSLAAIVERLRTKQGVPNADEARFVRDGKADIQVFLTDKTPEILAQLKALGFEIVLDPQASKFVIGRVSIDKLNLLAELKFVRYVAAQK